MTHKYPFGAIESEKPLLLGLQGQTLYSVHGLGSASFLTEMRDVRNLHTNGSGFRCVEYTSVTGDRSRSSSRSLGDLNIGKHHNHHYLFHNREDAEAYLAWAKTNTPEIRRDKYRYFGD